MTPEEYAAQALIYFLAANGRVPEADHSLFESAVTHYVRAAVEAEREQRTHMQVQFTQRGFVRIEFVDRYDHACSIQDSSIATEACIWLGCDEGTHVEGQCLARMHLTQELAAELIPILQRFIETGSIMT